MHSSGVSFSSVSAFKLYLPGLLTKYADLPGAEKVVKHLANYFFSIIMTDFPRAAKAVKQRVS